MRIFAKILSPQELERANRFHNPLHRSRYIVSHAVLRNILASYLNTPPRELKFDYGPHGKPSIAQPADSNLQYNMSHSNEMAFYAINLDGRVGVDVEYIKKDADMLGIAKRFFNKNEYLRLLQLPQNVQKEAFYQCWTLKEAYIKAHGIGLTKPLSSFEVIFAESDSENCLVKDQDLDEHHLDSWKIQSIFNEEGYIASLAVENGYDRYLLREWNLHS